MIAAAFQTLLAVAAIIVLARLNGLRSFSKMSSFDFALTVAAGSVLATVMTTSAAPWPALAALATLFALRFLISLLRAKVRPLRRLTDNEPLLLMFQGEVLEANLGLARVTKDDLRAKLREANALDHNKIQAVVLETTGDVSVLHGDRLDDRLLEGVSWGRATPEKPV